MASFFNIKKLFGGQEGSLSKYKDRVSAINNLEEEVSSLPDEAMRDRVKEIRSEIEAGANPDDFLPEVFALVREASKRTLEQRHYDVQLIGGMVLAEGNIAEMRTGEGKTLVATLAASLKALSGEGVHVITTNDYLARRDATWMGQIYSFLGLSVAVINHDSSYIYDESHASDEEDEERDEKGSFKIQYDFLRPVPRKEAYQADITYGTNSEFGFDYLRDNIQHDKDRVVQRGFPYAIIDEVDSILIDDARTPLIISAPVAESESLYGTFTDIARKLKAGEDYEVDEKQRAIELTESGIEKAEQALGIDNIYTEKGIKYVHHLETAVKAKALFNREKEYVVKDGEVIIVDQSTGRMQPGRRWSEGLHQAIEAKEGVEVKQESRTFASVTYQNFFRQYKELAGMTGTAKTSAEEFEKVYSLLVVEIPTNKPIARTDHNDQIFQTETGKFKAVARKVKELNEKGQPVLIGTVSIERNEMLSAFLKQEGVTHTVLNAKRHEEEGQVIADAGKKGAVTVSTNMAGRGIDIKLGGVDATEEEYEEIKSLGGLFVLGTERHDSRRVDNQLRGRSGRQGDPGETQFFVSLEDDLMRIFGSDRIKNMMGSFGMPEDQPIESRIITRSLESAQTKVEGFHFDARKHVLEYDNVLNHQRNTIYEKRNKILFGSDEEIEEILLEMTGGAEDVLNKIDTKKAELGEDFHKHLRSMMLQVIDMLWVEHLEQMEYMRGSVRLRAYGQRDPLVEYKKEGLHLFRELEDAIADNILEFLPRIGVIKQERQDTSSMREIHRAAKSISGNNQSVAVKAIKLDGDKIGRNDKVEIKSPDGNETKTLKYKKAEDLLEDGWTLVKKV